MADAEQRADQRMPAGLRQHALAGIDQQHREIGARGAGRHVARVLLVARAVGDDERAARGREIAVGDIDRDALLPLVLEPVEQQREIDVVAGRAEAPRIRPSSASSWSPITTSALYRRRPISVDLPSSTEPQVRNRRSARRSPRRRQSGSDRRALKIPLLFLAFHRGDVVGVDQPPLPLRGARPAQFGHDIGDRQQPRTRPRRSADSSRASGSAPCAAPASRPDAAAAGRHRP